MFGIRDYCSYAPVIYRHYVRMVHSMGVKVRVPKFAYLGECANIGARAAFGVADLKKAMEIQKSGPRRPYHVKTYIGLGDGYWQMDDSEKARAIWQEGLKEFPDNANLKARLAQQGDQLKATIEAGFDPSKRVDTDLRDLWANSNN